MGFLASIFTWWNGAGLTTRLMTRRHGREVGRDELGNIYYQHRRDLNRRWVIYHGANDASRTPPGWSTWLRGQIDDVPDKALPPRRPFEKPAVANLTGTGETYRPSGSLSRAGQRPAATGDYQAWTPD
ncbi:MAG: NADH:ubiquinone oxidoreductase 17.2 kD subunit [uncultured Sphingomonas sp.]|uniref:NADH:ubiquinone oxidoreductase 17.2 kD subunit n=1 Tax=uncultured Sphingomonas sp. TaxID=158754 RepID=A0A6J4SQ18_9SPHN|nr:NADH:ubiquinone oxidoreductase subunit NDUFA12 [uncultured Sphingomonas sp.]CAA9500411.1 MAG: NADH:ubiquinone oxidoreductase 17.2 kD subunit [uncultured Sphingomonas sp.]